MLWWIVGLWLAPAVLAFLALFPLIFVLLKGQKAPQGRQCEHCHTNDPIT